MLKKFSFRFVYNLKRYGNQKFAISVKDHFLKETFLVTEVIHS